MNLIAPVSKLMSTNLKTVSPTDTLLEVKHIFENHNIHHIPVVRFKEIVGMISKTDYSYFKHGFNHGDPDKRVAEMAKWKVEDIMTVGLAKLNSDDPIRTALDLFKLNRFHALPVLENDELAGILTPHDIIVALADEKIKLEDYKNAQS